MDYLEISEAYDAARRIVGKLEGHGSGDSDLVQARTTSILICVQRESEGDEGAFGGG